ncbi:MAG TPA: hypothetical protein VGS41_13085 [Chthonomonadales bacterium]|nr:hypothetical protein [Chthonomonadales bacterium]
MNRWLTRTITALALVTLVGTAAFAGQHKMTSKHKMTGKHKMAMAMCPVCHMPLSSKRTKMNTVAVKHGKGVMYCCSKCKMPASALAKVGTKKHHKPRMKKAAAK